MNKREQQDSNFPVIPVIPAPTKPIITVPTKVLVTREQLRLLLNEHGYPLTQSYFNKITLPSVNAGPPVEKWFGKRPLYDPDKGLAWAESRCTSGPARLAVPVQNSSAA